jgi:hypothetical protein
VEIINGGDGGAGQRRHEEVGSPRIPCLVIDGKPIRILQVSQIASALDLPMPEVGDTSRLAWDTVPILESFIEAIKGADFPYLLTPSKSRGRSIRNLTVNTFHPFELLPETWTSGVFDWNPELTDVAMEQPLTDLDAVVGYAEKVFFGWQGFLLDREDELQGEGPEVDTPRGRVTYNVVLSGQRFHAAWHHRQVVDHLRDGGFPTQEALDVEVLSADLVMPANIY